MRLAVAVCIVAIAWAPGSAQEPGRWADWPFVRPIELEAGTSGLVSVALPSELHARASRGLNDLRVIDERDSEVPFLIHAPRGVQRRDWRQVRLLETSVLPDAYTQVVVDTGIPVAPHNTIELAIRETDFFAWVEVAASDDRTTWRILDERLPLYRFARDGHAGAQILRHAPSASRFLRLRLLNADVPLTVTAVRVTEEITEMPAHVDVAATIAPAEGLPPRHTGWQADFGGAPPLSQAIFIAAGPEFHRPVRILASDDGRRWRPAGEGEIYRLRRADGTIERMDVTFPETSARYLRVEVFNRHDPPVPGLDMAFRGIPRHVVFRHEEEPGRSYRLIYGFGGAEMPSYELARLVTQADIRTAAAGALGAEAPMPGHPRPLPWSERHVVILWLAVGLAVAVLAWLAVRSLRSPPAQGT
jgi:hypothetical protein